MVLPEFEQTFTLYMYSDRQSIADRDNTGMARAQQTALGGQSTNKLAILSKTERDRTEQINTITRTFGAYSLSNPHLLQYSRQSRTHHRNREGLRGASQHAVSFRALPGIFRPSTS